MPRLESSFNIPRLLIAGTHSGVGKTTLAVGISAALRRRGLRVQPFKVGPDYIDPTYHTLAAGRTARTLDAWMIPRQHIPALFARAVEGADIAVIEGVMGFYDGFDYESEQGSTAEIARLLKAPVALVLDARSMARSAAAVALGFQTFARELPLAGFILNRMGSESHGRGVSESVERATGLPVFGWLPRQESVHIPERHLGLVPTAEPGRWQSFIQAAADLVERYLDIDALLATAHTAPPLRFPVVALPAPLPAQSGVRPIIAVARDAAFSFTYDDNLDLLSAAGAAIAFFSPLQDAALPARTSGVILSGGFPEVYAASLAANRAMHAALRQAHARGIPIYAECGGLMYLTNRIVDQDDRSFPMVGLLPGVSRMSGQLTLGYRLAEAAGDSWLLRAGEQVRGHEFHYSQWEKEQESLRPAYRLLPTRQGESTRSEGVHAGNLWASYVHLHFWNKPELAWRFVAACRRASREVA